MPVQAPQWTEFLLCPICTQTFEETVRRPISLGCGHTVCKMCLNKLHRKACPFDQTAINTDIEQLPVNSALLQLVGGQVSKQQPVALITCPEDTKHYDEARQCVEELALYLKPLSSARGVGLSNAAQSMLSRPMQRKLVTLVHCQLVEEEGRVRAMRAARSLGERTVTELILQHQNPQQLSSNLWAAVRARGCQFLGPAMQEEALKLVLLALEDGSALSRKVLVLFVVQRLEPRFPQASKTSIGHVVQLLYRASCFKVTKRDEDSSLMQLKEEFRTYEALRREHDSQIVQIAMEGGLRIAPDQWSSLLYGDQSHKSHMQSIIDKLQTPASFAQSVQELTIALQRTGDPANLNRLRPHLELLANIDPSPDAPPPTWEQLEKGLVAVKTVVHGLVDFIQNHSKKGADTQQPPQHSKYKTYMCRDMKQKGGCPRGASCTFAHSQEELEKYRKMNKRLAARVPCTPGLLPENVVTLEPGRKASMHTNGGPLPQLIPRGTDPSTYDLLLKPKMDATSLMLACHNAHNLFFFFFFSGNPYQYQPPQYVPSRYIRNPPPGEPPYPEPYPGYGPDRQYSSHHSGPPFSAHTYAQPSHYSRRHGHYPAPPPPFAQTRDDLVRMSPVPLDVPPGAMPQPPAGPAGSLYHSQEPSSRDRYPPDGYYTAGPHPSQMRSHIGQDPYSRSQPSLDDLHRRRKELLVQLEERKVISPPPFAVSLEQHPPYLEDGSKAFGSREPDYAGQYSPWSCDTIGSYIGSKDAKPKDVSSAVEMMNAEGKVLREPPLDTQRRSAEAKDDDPIIPFGPLPTVSPFGAISRTSKTGYQTTGPVQAIASSQASGSKHMTMTDYPYGNHSGWGGASYPQHQSINSQGHFSERYLTFPLALPHHLPVSAPDREQLKIELQQVNQQISQQTRGMEREACALASQPAAGVKWSSGGTVSSEQLSLELDHVELEIKKRTREIAMVSETRDSMACLNNVCTNTLILSVCSPLLSISEVSNGSSGMKPASSMGGSMLSLTNKTSSLTLCSADQAASSSDLQKNGVVHSCS
uniref:RING-type E3 ubiquitin transferase n=1 Tax=Cyprinus carpio carpio TaxID=630221 RepID=A0A8C1A0R7_CYPCA